MPAHELFASLMSALLLAGGVPAPEAVAPTYLLSMKLHDGATLVATPALRVKAGEVATVEIGDGKGHRYSVRLTVTPSVEDTLHVESAIDVVTREGHYSAEPSMIVRTGLPAGVMVGMVRDTSKPFRVDFTVDATAPR